MRRGTSPIASTLSTFLPIWRGSSNARWWWTATITTGCATSISSASIFRSAFCLQKYRRIKYESLFRSIDGIILHGQYVYDQYDHPHKYLNFYYGLDYSEIETRPWEEKENLILFVGGDYFRKGIHRLLRALPLVLSEGARCPADGDRQRLRLCEDHLPGSWPAGCRWSSSTACRAAELYKTYGRAKAFVMPSEIEAIPLVSSEATMAGVPPILSDGRGKPGDRPGW